MLVRRLRGIDFVRGLMFRNPLKFKDIVLFDFGNELSPEKIALTNLFVFDKTFVMFLNKDRIVVDYTIMNPFELVYTPRRKARYVIESFQPLVYWLGEEVVFSECVV